MTEFNIAHTKEQYILIERLGKIVWRKHYTPIIGSEQVEYMLKKFQSAKMIENQVSQGYRYYIISKNNNPAGYLSIREKATVLFLSKFYVLKDFRGQGLGKIAMAFIEGQGKIKNCNKVTLTVNKYNTNSIQFYKKMGFVNTGALVQDIGNGFIMDDLSMEKIL